MTNPILAETWRKYRGWALRARGIRQQLDRGHRWVLGLTVAGAVLATLAARWGVWTVTKDLPHAVPTAQGLSALSAVAMATAAYLARAVLEPERERHWVRARSLAESAKSEAYRFAVQATPYDGADAGTKLLDRLQELIASGEDIPAREVTDDEVAKGLPIYPLPVEDYIATRIDDQVGGYYRPSAEKNERKATLCAVLVQVLSGVAAVLAAIGAIYSGTGIEAWVATLGAVTSAIGAYALGQRYQRLAASYRVTADRLALRLAAYRLATQAATDPALARALIIDSEAILAAENQAWMTDRLRPAAPASGGG